MFICNCLSFQQLGYIHLRMLFGKWGVFCEDPALNMMLRPADAFEAKEIGTLPPRLCFCDQVQLEATGLRNVLSQTSIHFTAWIPPCWLI